MSLSQAKQPGKREPRNHSAGKFSKVKFAAAATKTKTKPGKLVCVHKQKERTTIFRRIRVTENSNHREFESQRITEKSSHRESGIRRKEKKRKEKRRKEEKQLSRQRKPGPVLVAPVNLRPAGD